jgi:hypothetical protein
VVWRILPATHRPSVRAMASGSAIWISRNFMAVEPASLRRRGRGVANPAALRSARSGARLKQLVDGPVQQIERLGPIGRIAGLGRVRHRPAADQHPVDEVTQLRHVPPPSTWMNVMRAARRAFARTDAVMTRHSFRDRDGMVDGNGAAPASRRAPRPRCGGPERGRIRRRCTPGAGCGQCPGADAARAFVPSSPGRPASARCLRPLYQRGPTPRSGGRGICASPGQQVPPTGQPHLLHAQELASQSGCPCLSRPCLSSMSVLPLQPDTAAETAPR